MKRRNSWLTGIFLGMVMAILMVFAFALTASAEELPMAYLTLTDTEIQLSTTKGEVEIAYPRNVSFDTYERCMMLDSLRAAQWTAGESERLVLGNGGTGIKDGQFNWILILDTTDTDFRLRINKGCMLSGIIDKNGNDVTVPGVVDNYSGTIAGGTYSGEVSNYSDSYITGGTFSGPVWNKGYITGGTFSGTITNVTNGYITGGTIDGTIVNSGGIVEMPEEVQTWPIYYHYRGYVISGAGGDLDEDLAYYTTGTEKTEFPTAEDLKARMPSGAVEGTLDGWYDYDAIVDELGNWDLSQCTEANRVTKIPADSTGEVNLIGRWKYHLTVENGSGSGDYYDQEIVTITAEDPGDRVFLGWTNDDDNPDLFIGGPDKLTTTVRVEPELTVTANYHTHAWNEEWIVTETHHWHECEDESCPVTADFEKSGYGAHTMTYAVDGTTISKVCSGCGTGHDSVTLLDPDADEALVYDGQPKAVSVTGTIEGETPVITYSTADGSAPVEPGTYTADMTIGGQSVRVEYVIGKLEPQIGTVTCGMDVVYENSMVVLTCENTAVPGTLKLVEETLTAGTQEYHWEFIPEDGDRYEMETGTITLTVYDRFDINLDGVLNLLDVTRAQRFYGKADAIADLDNSGMVDIQDLILILNYIYG